MIQSDTLPHDAVDYLNKLEAVKNLEANQLGRIGARQELLNWCWQWFVSARTWRKQSWEDDWLTWQRNADGRYDPRLASKKKDWQAKAFVDLTPSHRETIHAELYRLVAGSQPLCEVSNRPGGDEDNAENIEDLIKREFERMRFEVHYNAILEDRSTYGSGFCQIWFENKTRLAPVRQPVLEPLDNMGAIKRQLFGQRQQSGWKTVLQEVQAYRGVKIRHIPIWDLFLDPKSLGMKNGKPVLFRSWIGLQEILDNIKNGDWMPESGQLMSQSMSNETTPADKQLLQMERGIADVSPRREGNQKEWEAYEMHARVPQKWAYPLLKVPLPIDNAEQLVSVIVKFTQQTVFSVEFEDTYDGEPNFYKDDYFPVANRLYGRGIPEMLKNPQMVVNEVVNQRLDEGNLALQQGFAVVEKAVVNTEDLTSGGPGLIVRMDQKKLGPNGDVRNAILPLERPDVKINAGFSEVHEWERMAQERTSVNRAQHGPVGLPGGQKTLGGMQMLKKSESEKFAYIAMLSEFRFMYEIFRGVWQLIYANITPQDVLEALGPQRAQTFQLMSPEQIENQYRFQPKGIFEREGKAEKQGRLAAMREQFKGAPWWNDLANYSEQAKSFGMDPQANLVPQAEQLQIQSMAQQMAEPMARQMVTEIILGQAVKDVERNLAEKAADEVDGADPRDNAKVTNLDSNKEPKGKI